MEFHVPQASHCPDHLVWEAPQEVQVKEGCFAIGSGFGLTAHPRQADSQRATENRLHQWQQS